MTQDRDKVKSKIIETLKKLSGDEQKLLNEVLLLEAQNLHLKRPQIGDEIVKIVKQVVK